MERISSEASGKGCSELSQACMRRLDDTLNNLFDTSIALPFLVWYSNQKTFKGNSQSRMLPIFKQVVIISETVHDRDMVSRKSYIYSLSVDTVVA